MADIIPVETVTDLGGGLIQTVRTDVEQHDEVSEPYVPSIPEGTIPNPPRDTRQWETPMSGGYDRIDIGEPIQRGESEGQPMPLNQPGGE